MGEVSRHAVHSSKPRFTSSSLPRRSHTVQSQESYHHTKGRASSAINVHLCERGRESPFPAMPGHSRAVLTQAALKGHGLKSSGFLQGCTSLSQTGRSAPRSIDCPCRLADVPQGGFCVFGPTVKYRFTVYRCIWNVRYCCMLTI